LFNQKTNFWLGQENSSQLVLSIALYFCAPKLDAMSFRKLSSHK
jgi:hypothetical protein